MLHSLESEEYRNMRTCYGHVFGFQNWTRKKNEKQDIIIQHFQEKEYELLRR